MSATREKTFLLARPEARMLEWIARRLPTRVTPDQMTALGVHAARAVAVPAPGDRPRDRDRLPGAVDRHVLETHAFGVFSLGYGRLGPPRCGSA